MPHFYFSLKISVLGGKQAGLSSIKSSYDIRRFPEPILRIPPIKNNLNNLKMQKRNRFPEMQKYRQLVLQTVSIYDFDLFLRFNFLGLEQKSRNSTCEN